MLYSMVSFLSVGSSGPTREKLDFTPRPQDWPPLVHKHLPFLGHMKCPLSDNSWTFQLFISLRCLWGHSSYVSASGANSTKQSGQKWPSMRQKMIVCPHISDAARVWGCSERKMKVGSFQITSADCISKHLAFAFVFSSIDIIWKHHHFIFCCA